MPEWRNGRRARLKIVFRKEWRFESSLRHRVKKKVLVILGPTAIGKSGLSIKLAQKLKGEVISADSRQVYKGLDIGTGKVTKSEMKGIPHHLLDVADPKKVFNVSDFKTLGEKALEEIIRKNKLPIIVGGTGFYIDTLTGSASLPQVPENKKLRKELDKKTTEQLFKILEKKDPRRAKNIDKHNKVRLIRALEIIEALGKVPEVRKEKSKYKFVYVGLTLPQEKLDIKIKKRLDERMKIGMIKEAQKLHKQGLSFKRMENLGLEYKYLSLFLQKKLSKEEMVEKLNTEIRQYSRRQITWFKRNKKIKWFSPMDPKEILTYVRESIQ